LFGAWGDTVSIDGTTSRSMLISMPEVDLVIMNPPFTRTQGGSRLLGSLDPETRPRARANLSRLGARSDIEGRIVAGLGSLFIPLADRMIRPGGRMAFVLPKTMLTGTQWDRTRGLLSDTYHVEYIVCSHETDHWNFSDSTDLAEILLVARKPRVGEDLGDASTTWVQLSRNPDNAIDALGVATAILQARDTGADGVPIRLGGTLFSEFGQAFTRPAPKSQEPWRHATFANGQLDLG
jgi:hypothetical protein